jgi:hypothetical protein
MTAAANFIPLYSTAMCALMRRTTYCLSIPALLDVAPILLCRYLQLLYLGSCPL